MRHTVAKVHVLKTQIVKKTVYLNNKLNFSILVTM